MKKKLAMGLILCLALGAFAACSQDTTEGEETQGQEQQEEGTEDGAGEEEDEPEEETDDGGDPPEEPEPGDKGRDEE